jgi:CheY-like chemotaxis protein
MADDIQQSRESGFQEHLTKPVDISALERAMVRAIGPRGS